METRVEQVCGKIDKLIVEIKKNGYTKEGPFLVRSWNRFVEHYDWIMWILLGWALVKWLGFGESPKNLLKLFNIH